MRSLNRFGQIALFIGGLLAGSYAPSLLFGPKPQPLGYLLIIVALVAFSILAAQIRQIEYTQPPFQFHREIIPIMIGAVLAGIAMLLTPLLTTTPWLILTLWVSGWASILVGAWVRDRNVSIIAEQRFARWEVYAVGGLTMFALLARGIMVDRIPFSVHGDEGEMGGIARTVLHGTMNQPFVTAFLDHPTLWFFVQALSLRLFGDTLNGLRICSVVIGTATIPICYLYTRDNFGRRVALTATILLAAYHFHIHFSRVALNNIVDPLITLIAFAAFMRGWRNGSWLAFAVAGTAAGLAQHFYMGGRLILVIIGLLLLHQAIVQRAKLREYWQGLAVMGLAIIAAFGPLLRFFIEHPNAYMARIDAVGLFQTGRIGERLAQGWSLSSLLIDQANRSFGAYLYVPDTSLFYAPDGALLDPIQGALFLCGIAIAIVGITQLNRFLLLAWIGGVAIFGGMLLIDPPQSARYVIATPAICILIAAGLHQAGILLRKFALPDRIADVSIAVAAIALAVANLSWYFGTYTPELRYGGTRDLTIIAYHMQQLAPDRYTFFLGPPYAYIKHGTISFLANGHDGIDIIDPMLTPEQVPTPPPHMHAVFIALPARTAELSLVQARYPGGKLSTIQDPLGIVTPLFMMYEAP